MQSCRKCCASAEISVIALAGFIFIKFLTTALDPLYRGQAYVCIFVFPFLGTTYLGTNSIVVIRVL